MAFQLRPYQETALNSVRGAYRSGTKRVLLVAPTGSGKSAMMRYMIGNTKMRVLILVHRQELLEMVGNDLGMPHSLILPGKPTPRHGQIFVGMMQTVAKRLHELPEIDWVISDEAHLAMCATWQSILDHYREKWQLGMSASPCRLDGKGLGLSYEKIVQGPSIKELTSRGFLVPCRAFAPPTALTTVKKTGADFNMADAAAQLDRASITGDVVQTYLKHAAGKQAVVFCCTCEHAEHVAAVFNAAGIPAANVDGTTMNPATRKARIAEFKAKRLMILVNVDLLTTGWDCPQVEVEIMLRPTMSLALYLQKVGRVLRISPGTGKREAILLDHVGNVLRHGMPDADREWSLEGAAKRSAPPPVRQCQECYAAHSPSPRCPSCGYVYAAAPATKAPPKARAGELREVTAAAGPGGMLDPATPFKEALRMCRTKADLQAMAKARGYHHRWVTRMMEMKGIRDTAPAHAEARAA